MLLPAVGVVWILLAATRVAAQQFAIDWFTIDGGGGSSTGGVYSASGTIGQPDAGFLRGGTYTLAGGFWGIEAATSESAPQLRIRLEFNGNVVVSWPNPSAGFHLETAGSLMPPVQWIDQGDVGTVIGNEKQILVPTSAPTLFFRLRKP